jgi:D-threo-aldose 1-dehydrogenase
MKLERRLLGNTGIRVPAIGFGTSGLGGMPETYGYDVEASQARATVEAILKIQDGFIDTSRLYGFGRSEERIGATIAERGGWPAGRILATKLDRDVETRRFDAAQARRSLEASLTALGVGRLDILHLHDPEYAADLSEVTRKGGALDELMKMKAEGLASAVGLAAGRIDVMMPIVRDWDFDIVLTHNRYTLVNRNADPLIKLALERGMAVFNAAPYAGGAFAKGTASFRRYVYQEAGDETLEPLRRIEAICARYGVPAGAVALQFSLRDPRITSTICGVSKPERVAETVAWAAVPVPDALWEEVTALPFSSDDPEASRVYNPG